MEGARKNYDVEGALLSPKTPGRGDARLAREQSAQQQGGRRQSDLFGRLFPHGFSQRRRGSLDSAKPEEAAEVPEETDDVKAKKCRQAALLEVVKLAKQHDMSTDAMWEIWSKFEALGPDSAGNLQTKRFVEYVKAEFGIHPFRDGPLALLPKQRELEAKELISFLEYFHWVRENSFTKELAVQGCEKSLRRLASDLRISLLEAEKLRSVFNRYDANKDGELDVGEFKIMLCDLLHTPGDSMPEATLTRYFRQIDAGQNGCVRLREFATWYYKSFVKEGRAVMAGIV
eukprot:TRINITY_DN14958_c0_g1_i3.p1 TRINITY_DN14958_c0_g1~~TRINITY_DN14958_c0_g1_i3.p1  ORF type:complete len:287 (+),score=68.05 TRINITY_DN14958_c0_g1_i3:640-1500(+)